MAEAVRRAASQRARPARWKASRSGSRTCSAPRACARPPCSHILDNFMPPYEFTVTANLWRDGAVMLGKLNMDEFAMGSSNETSRFGPVVNPWRRAGSNRPLTPGGSSGGSAAAVAARSVPGGDRRPTPAARSASRRPSPARSASSRPTAAARAGASSPSPPRSTRPARSPRRCEDAAILLRSMAGHDAEGHHLRRSRRCRTYAASIGKSVKGLRIGVPKEYRARRHAGGDREAVGSRASDWLKDAGCEMVEVSLPHTKYALPAYYIVAPAEASSNLARYDGMRYGLRVDGRDLIDMYERHARRGFRRRGAPPGADRHLCALGRLLRRLLSEGAEGAPAIADDFERCFARSVDALLTPAAPSAAFGLGEKARPIRSRCI